MQVRYIRPIGGSVCILYKASVWEREIPSDNAQPISRISICSTGTETICLKCDIEGPGCFKYTTFSVTATFQSQIR
jgi:hypothetical protein